MRVATALALAACALAPRLASAQRSARCTAIDTTAAWYRKQQAWMADDARHAWSNDSLRTALIKAAGLDANPRAAAGTLLGYEITGTTPTAGGDDATALSYLVALTKNRGATWPTRSVVGAGGVRAVWLLSGRDSSLARVALHRMMEAGPDESPPSAVAMLEDRLRVAAGRKQLYGTQLVRKSDGTLEPSPIEDPKHVDLRRDAAGLPPLAQSLCAAGK